MGFESESERGMKTYDEMSEKEQAVVTRLWDDVVMAIFNEGIPFGYNRPSEIALWNGVVLLVAEQIDEDRCEAAASSLVREV